MAKDLLTLESGGALFDATVVEDLGLGLLVGRQLEIVQVEESLQLVVVERGEASPGADIGAADGERKRVPIVGCEVWQHPVAEFDSKPFGRVVVLLHSSAGM